jgi:ATP-dependent phosphofructokinase / diphosphate-dependent phosphofructokinase
MPPEQKICLVSGGGDAPGVNSALRAFVHAAQRLGIETVGCRRGLAGMLVPCDVIPLSIVDVRGVLPRGGSFLGCSTRVNPFFVRAADGSTRDESVAVVERFRELGIDGVVFVGGDGTTLAARRFARLGMQCICVPKTIDNDLAGTETTIGFDTAVATATHAIDSLHATAESHSRVMLVEVMGRNAGWIALTAGVAGGADVVLLPELPYRLENVLAKIRERDARGLSFTLVVVAEGARPEGEGQSELEKGRPGHLARLGGAGERLRELLEASGIDHEVRLTVLGHLQRGGSPAASDRALGALVGAFAAELCKKREFGRRIVLRGNRVEAVALEDSGPSHKLVDLNGQLARSASLLGIALGNDLPNPGRLTREQ